LLVLNALVDHFASERRYFPLSGLFADRVELCLLRFAVLFGLNSLTSSASKHRRNHQ
jgi:hypothetical protein